MITSPSKGRPFSGALLAFFLSVFLLPGLGLAGPLDEGRAFFEEGDFPNAVGALAQVPVGAPERLQAQALMGRGLDAMGLSQLALNAFAEVLAAGPQHEAFEEAFNASAALSRFVGDHGTFGAALTGLSQETLPDLERGYGLYVAGLSLLEADRMKPAVAFLSAVPRGDDAYVSARLQLARALVSLGERPMAFAVLEDLHVNHRAALEALPDGLGLVTVNLARLSYGMGLYQDAAIDYAKVPRTSPFWTESLMERSWASFALWQQEGQEDALRRGLGTLFALTSPAMSTLYFPEAWLLEAQIFYFLCKPTSGAKVIVDFLARFDALHTQLGEGLTQLGDDDLAYYAAALDYRRRGETSAPIPGPLLALFLSDPSFDQIEGHLEKVEREIKSVKAQSRAWDPALQEAFTAKLKAHGDALRGARGAVVRARLKAEYGRLGQTLVATQVAQLELITQEMELYQAAAAGLVAERKEKKGRWTLPGSRTRTWPFEGEFWLDELGYYQVNTTEQCAALGQ